MNRHLLLRATLLFIVIAAAAPVFTNAQVKPARDPKQPIDEEYTKKIREYTTETFFNSPLTDYLPASPNVPTPKAVLGDVAGAPGKLPYAAEVYRYMRMLEKASPRVKVYSIGTTEEGREMIAVAVASESLLGKLDENRARLAKLADPRTINMNDDEADRLVAASFPIYYITGTIHSTETGSPTALMELAYRLAVDESPYVRTIRDNMVTLITPVVEVDGRDRMVDVYNWHLANPNSNWPPLIYWGHYVAHDNNRDAIGLSLKLTRNVLNTYTRLEGAGAPRPARVSSLSLRQHDWRWSLQRLGRSDSDRRVADDWLEQRFGDDQVWHAGRVCARKFRHLVARLSDVHRCYSQWHQPSLRNVWQCRRGHGRAHAFRRRVFAHLVSPESAAAESEMVTAQQQ